MAGAVLPGEGSPRAVLARLQDELAELARRSDDLQAAIGDLVAAAGLSPDRGMMVRLQAADAISQKLGRLAELTGALQPEASATVDPAFLRPGSPVALALARVDGIGVAPAEDQGDCDFF